LNVFQSAGNFSRIDPSLEDIASGFLDFLMSEAVRRFDAGQFPGEEKVLDEILESCYLIENQLSD
jgi:hypothetical protein